MTPRLPVFLALLALGCATGSVQRPEPEKEDGGLGFDVGDDDDQPSESQQAALANQPTDKPVSDVPRELACSSDPGTKVLQRLNRFEYNNTVRDLLGVDWNPADAFPKDDFGDSFDNNGRALSISPLLASAYLEAAEKIAAEVTVNGSPVQNAVAKCRPSDLGVDECARITAAELLTRAFRRPVFDSEINLYADLFGTARDNGASYWEAMQVMVEATLLSVNFLFRVELDPASTRQHALTDYELASRLSYFLWSSMPDDALFQRAAAGDLNTEAALREEVTRMLEDPKAESLLHAFFGRWLEVDDIAESNRPATDLFPTFTPALKAAMEKETRLFLRDLLRGELSYDQALTAGYTYVNQDLADHYEFSGTFTNKFTRTSLEGTARSGLLTQGSVLTLTGAPNRTSPVRRGVYVLSNLLCSTPPPPPGNVQGNLDTVPDAGADAGTPEPTTLIDRARQHSEDPACYTCHSIMDPIGFGLENFDAVGRYREEENGKAIDSSGKLLLSGKSVSFESAIELSELLSKEPRFSACAARKAFTFALGRQPSDSEADDACRIDNLDAAFRDADYDIRELLLLITLTDSFRGRQGEAGRETATRPLTTSDAGAGKNTEQ
jgi:hypothetical protein